MIAIMSGDHFSKLDALVEHEVRLGERQSLFRAGDAVRHLYVVREGDVRLVRHQACGDALVLQRARAGQVLAEASVFASRYHCDAVTTTGATLGRIPKARVLGLQQQDPEWLRAFAAYLAGEVQRARARAELLSLRRVGARLDAWLAFNGEALPPRGQWIELAAELGVTPEALYRELALRRADG